MLMMSRYGAISSYLDEAETAAETSAPPYESILRNISYDIAEGNYLLYNEYAQQTDPAEVLQEYGQRNFDLTEKYLDYGIFDSEGQQLLAGVDETTAERLTAAEEDYAFRVKYIFTENGDLGGYTGGRKRPGPGTGV